LSTLEILGAVVAVLSVAALGASFIKPKPKDPVQESIKTKRGESEVFSGTLDNGGEVDKKLELRIRSSGMDILSARSRQTRGIDSIQLLMRLERIERDIAWLIRGLAVMFGFISAIAFTA
jgi:hypothetical protein